MINNMMCSICTDYKKAKIKENELRLCFDNIKKVGRGINVNKITLNYKDKGDILLLSKWHTNIHFMCGKCMKFNETNMRNQYKELCEEVIRIKRALVDNKDIDDKKKKFIKFELMKITQGRFSILTNYIERNFNKIIE